MALLDELVPGAAVKGLLPGVAVTVISVKRHGSSSVELVYQDAGGRLGSELLYSDGVANLEITPAGLPWQFDADGALFRLVSEAYRIRLAYLFDPLIAVHTSLIEPLPHQITAVYETMLGKQPLRYLLADDPGAGKTIMTGLLIKELMIRGDLHRCLIVSPGNLVEQWQDELRSRFHITFDILTNDRLEASASGNVFTEMPLCIARLDKLSRDEQTQEKLRQTEWDLIVVDEAHKMSATFFGGEVKYTKRYQLGEMLGKITRHLVLLTATPHNGKEEDFQLFMRLLDADRFEGRFRDGTHKVDVSDLMRHFVKEQLFTFEGRPLFPERLAYTVNYALSDREDTLYQAVTDYVREEFNRADALENNGRKGTVGFALITLQRRLASSPEAIYQSLRRRRERLERRVQEARQAKHAPDEALELFHGLPLYSEDDLDDLDDAPGAELEEAEQRVVDQASAARTIAELDVEIALLARLEELAYAVRRSGNDRKWEGLASLLQDNAEMFDAEGHRLKLVIFTEHRDTLNYLTERIRTMLGRPEAVVTIHGGLSREERARAQESFTQEKQTQVLVATDAAGEGINLQRAHLMVNYDLPWNPNRLEQRFGRIHRIGQTEVCHLWNLVAEQTREGEVFHTLLKKLEEERDSLGGQVFDVLGKVLFNQRPLRDLMVEAIRYGDRPDVRARLTRVVDEALDHQHLQTLLDERALAREVMDVVRVRQIREEMERAAAHRLQPHFIAAFFLEALKRLGGKCYEREPHRYEITHVPSAIRNRTLHGNARATILRQYERVVFEKERITVPGKPTAAFVCPGHPLLDATLDLILEQYRPLLTQGSILVDPTDNGEAMRVLFYLEHTIQDASLDTTGKRREVSRQLQYIERDEQGNISTAGYAPFLDYRPLTPEETPALLMELNETRRGRFIAPTADVSANAPVADTEVSPVKPVKACHSERSEESGWGDAQILRFAQNDTARASHMTDFVRETSVSANAPVADTSADAINRPLLAAPWLTANLEEQARTYAITHLVPRHLAEVRQRREEQIDKTIAAVNDRLTREISYWDNRAANLKAQEAAGKINARLNSHIARQRAEDLLARRERRLTELEQERKLSPLPPVIVGGVLVVPQGLLNRLIAPQGLDGQDASPNIAQFAHETARVEHLAMEAVMQAERTLGYLPRDVSADKCGYDIESRIPGTGKLRFLEVKGRVKGATTVIVTKNEILTALNKPDDFILAIVEVDGETTTTHYLSRPFQREPDFDATSVMYDLAKLLHKGVIPV